MHSKQLIEIAIYYESKLGYASKAELEQIIENAKFYDPDVTGKVLERIAFEHNRKKKLGF